MAIAFVNVGAWNGSGSDTSLILAVPSGVADGDLLLAVVSIRSVVAITPPAGWTLQIGGNYQYSAYTKIAASEPANYTWSWTGATNTGGAIAAYRGVDQTTPMDAAASSTSGKAPSLNTVTANALVVVGAGNQASITAPGGSWTERLLCNTSGVQRIYIGDQIFAATGATGGVAARSRRRRPAHRAASWRRRCAGVGRRGLATG
jgi:hypothetical protein